MEEEERGRYGKDEIERINKNYYKRIRERRACKRKEGIKQGEKIRNTSLSLAFPTCAFTKICDVTKSITFIQQHLKYCC